MLVRRADQFSHNADCQEMIAQFIDVRFVPIVEECLKHFKNERRGHARRFLFSWNRVMIVSTRIPRDRVRKYHSRVRLARTRNADRRSPHGLYPDRPNAYERSWCRKNEIKCEERTCLKSEILKTVSRSGSDPLEI